MLRFIQIIRYLDRYHKFRLRNSDLKKNRASISLKDLNALHPGDYVVHTDHGVGRFGGLQKIEVGGNMQETIRIVIKIMMYSL